MHHSQEYDEMIAKIMQENGKQLGLGPTGKFPEGHLTPTDEGEIAAAVTNYEGKVIVNFNSPVHWFGLTPGQARELALSLRQHANKAEGK